jgi:hypothetical protein
VSGDIEFALTPGSPVAPRRRSFALATSSFHRIWPVAGIGFAVLVNVAWMGFLGLEFFKLIEAAFL